MEEVEQDLTKHTPQVNKTHGNLKPVPAGVVGVIAAAAAGTNTAGVSHTTYNCSLKNALYVCIFSHTSLEQIQQPVCDRSLLPSRPANQRAQLCSCVPDQPMRTGDSCPQYITL